MSQVHTLDRSEQVTPVQAASPSEQRLTWLFRDSLRRQQIHPLLNVMRRYRERPAP